MHRCRVIMMANEVYQDYDMTLLTTRRNRRLDHRYLESQHKCPLIWCKYSLYQDLKVEIYIPQLPPSSIVLLGKVDKQDVIQRIQGTPLNDMYWSLQFQTTSHNHFHPSHFRTGWNLGEIHPIHKPFPH